MYYDENLESYMLDVPRECPKHGCELELDINQIDDDTYTTILYCPEPDCDFEFDATEEFRQVQEAKAEEDEDD